MPGSTKKSLHLAKNLTELNSKTGGVAKVLDGQCRLYANTTKGIFSKAESSDLLGDEESAYVLYMRFLNIVTLIRKNTEYKKNKKYYDDLIGLQKITTAISQAEVLSSSLKDRYEEREAVEVSAKLEKLDKESENVHKEEELAVEKNGEVEEQPKEETPDDILAKKGLMGGNKLYGLMYDDNTSLLIMDVRLGEQYHASHINYTRCINIPKEIIHAGCTVRHLEEKLPNASKDEWNKRGNVDFIIIVDWTSRETDLQPRSTICSLKDAIFKWDQDTVIKSEPLVLEGGYEEWLNMYPTLTTNANVPKPPSYTTVTNNAVSLETIDYDLDLNFLKSPEELEAEKAKNLRNNIMSVNENIKPPAIQSNMPVIPDRKSKPLSNNMVIPMNARSSDNIERINNDLNTTKTTNLLDLRKKLEMGGDTLPPVKNVNIVNEKNDVNNVSEIAKPMPSIDRTLKPKSKLNNNIATTDKESVIISKEVKEVLPSDFDQISDNSSQVESQAEVDALHKEQEVKQQELDAYKMENKRLALETEARRAKLGKEKEQYERISEMKTKAQEETEELNRKKEAIENEIKQLETEKKNRLAEEERRLEELERIKKDEEEKKAELKLKTEKLRQERKRAAEEGKRKAQLAKEQQRKQKELEEKIERDRQMKEAKAKEAKETDAQLQAEREKKEKENFKMKQKEKRDAEMTGAPMLPVGWEKRYDEENKKYYYLNHHTKQTQWDPPKVQAKSSAQPKGDVVYKTKLRTEDDLPSSGGLKRSHSSPNIAKLMQDEEESISTPGVNRSSKPQLHPNTVRSMDLHKFRAVSEAKVRNFNPVWGSVNPGLSGLRNQGNTCYMNSTLQCMSNTAFLTTYLLSDNYRSDINVKNKFGTRGEIAEEYAALVKAMWQGHYKSVTPREFKLSCARYCSTFAGYDQQDSQELLSYLMDWLHEDLNKIQDPPKLPEQQNDDIPEEKAAAIAWKMHKSCHDSIIVQLFQGQYKSTVKCNVCDKKSITFDTFMFLSLDIPSQSRCSLKECLMAYCKEEKMTGDSKWNCPRCHMKRDATKRIVIWKLPPILIIVLKRFYHKGMWRQKNSAYVDFPIDNVDFNGFVAGPKSSKPYSLYAMSNHYGTMEGGHYTAFCKNPNLERWFKFDDHEVYEYSKSDIKTSAAYFLFYSSI